MRKSSHHVIREHLTKQPDGATVVDIARDTGLHDESVRRALKAMPDTYIDRWVHARRNNRLQPVWAAVAVPPDCPKP